MKNTDQVEAGTLIALPSVSYAYRVAIVTRPSPPSDPYLDYIVLEVSSRTGEFGELRAGTSQKEKTHELVPRIDFSPSSCGHSSQYAYSEDGGKTIECLLCEHLYGRQCPRCHCRGEIDLDNLCHRCVQMTDTEVKEMIEAQKGSHAER
jgi:hypothetical protein